LNLVDQFFVVVVVLSLLTSHIHLGAVSVPFSTYSDLVSWVHGFFHFLEVGVIPRECQAGKGAIHVTLPYRCSQKVDEDTPRETEESASLVLELREERCRWSA
jgi:hypothetical protein